MCPSIQTASPGVSGIVEIGPLSLTLLQIEFAPQSVKPFEPATISPLSELYQAYDFIKPMQSQTLLPVGQGIALCRPDRNRRTHNPSRFCMRSRTT